MNAYLEFDSDAFRNKTILLPCDDPEWSNFTRFFAMNFSRLGLKKLISTSYAPLSRPPSLGLKPTDIERSSPRFDEGKALSRGKIFVLEKDSNSDGVVDLRDLDWDYLQGDGDFRSPEVELLRDESDVIITNPPFSLFRDFLAWVEAGKKSFSLIGNLNAITYKEVFPLIKDNKMWMGRGFNAGNAYFKTLGNTSEYSAGVFDKNSGLVKFRNACWFTNLEHGRRHEPLRLMTMADNLKFHGKMKEKASYDKYDNYEAIDVPNVDAIPSDYFGVMGVPISYLDKYCPEQFEILGCNRGIDQDPKKIYGRSSYINGKETFKRIFIRKIQ